MSCIAVNELEPGMVLSEDVLDVNTRLLLSKGQKIIPKHIRVLKIWGINEVNIVGDAKDVIKIIPPSDPEKESRVKEAVDIVFRHLNHEHPILNEIRRVSLTYRLQKDVPMCPMSTPQPLRADGSLDRPKNVGRHIQKIDAKLPEAPFIITELNNVIADDHSTSNDVAQVVNKSPSLSAVILKIVNSAFYGFPIKIDRISRAVTIIGTKQISSVALGICVMQAFKDIPKEFLDTKAFLRHSLACGLVARVLGAFKNMADTEQLFVSGLLHDIGKLIAFKYYPEHAGKRSIWPSHPEAAFMRARKEPSVSTTPKSGVICLENGVCHRSWKRTLFIITAPPDRLIRSNPASFNWPILSYMVWGSAAAVNNPFLVLMRRWWIRSASQPMPFIRWFARQPNNWCLLKSFLKANRHARSYHGARKRVTAGQWR